MGQRLEQHATVMRVIVLEPNQAQNRRPYIGVVAEDLAETTQLEHARAHHTEPCLGNVVLEIAVVPGEARLFDEAARCSQIGLCGRAA